MSVREIFALVFVLIYLGATAELALRREWIGALLASLGVIGFVVVLLTPGFT